MCLNLFNMDDCHFSNITKVKNKTLYLIILGKIKTCNSSKNGYILHLMKITLLKIQWKHFWIHIELTNIIGQFKQKYL
jgi:hypothetical protein